LAIAVASATVIDAADPELECTPLAVVAPGMTMMRLFPRLAICCCTAAFAPRPMLTIVNTAATPMMTPSMVSAERSTFRRIARSAVTTVIQRKFMRERPPWRAGTVPAVRPRRSARRGS